MPFAKWRTKEWGDERFIELGRKIASELNARIIILGGTRDKARSEKIANAIGEEAASCAGPPDLLDTPVLLALSDCLISNDTGVMHMGSAVSIPVIAIFGSTTEELGFFPFKAEGEVVQADLGCRPCTAKGLPRCPKKHFKCMNDIPVEKVYNIFRKYI